MRIEDQIGDLERIVGVALPSDYRSWLAAGDRSVPQPDFYWVVKGDWGSGIEILYGFEEPDDLRTTARDRHDSKVPADLLVIGDDGMAGTYLAIGLSGKRTGRMYFIDTVSTESGDLTPDSAIHEIGPSFAAWMRSLRASPDDD
ncbi:MAG TPA: SMI1/KNR4 family protein [Planctomycetota bacterium]|nr:SMI1/KNR4 family protein [Planctomycetota bacterium]